MLLAPRQLSKIQRIINFKLIFFFGFFSFLFPNSLTDLKIKRIDIVGNQLFKDLAKSLTAKIGISLDSNLLVTDQKIIRDKYAQAGFFWTEVNHQIETISNGLILRWEIKENKQAQIGKIEITENRNLNSSFLTERLKFNQGAFSQKKVEANIQALLETYLDSGYVFCQIEPKNFKIENYQVSYTFKVSEGPKVQINEVQFNGTFMTKPEVLRRIMGLGTDWIYSETKVRKGIRRLKKTNLYEVLKYNIKRWQDEYFLSVEIKEKKSNEIQAAFAFLPKTEEQQTEYSGLTYINIKNLFGTLRQVKALWAKNIYRTNYEISYIEPYLFGLGINLGCAINHETRDTTYAKTNFNIFTDISVQDNLILRFESGYELVVPGISDIDRVQTYWAGNGISFDSRDKSINPRKGIYAQLTNRIGRKMIKYQAAHLVAKTYFDSELVLPFTNKFNLTFLLNGRNLYTSDTVNFFDLFYLGGSRTLRGYQEEAFSSTRVFWLNNELRWLTDKESRFFPFYDIGIFLKDQQYETKMSYGLGLRVGSRIGLFGIDYGLAFGENPLNGKVHLSLISQF